MKIISGRLASESLNGIINSNLAKSIKKIGNGLGSAWSEVIGLSAPDGLSSQVRAMDRARGDVQDGVSLFQAAEGALDEIKDRLGRVRELALSASAEGTTPEDRTATQAEIKTILTQIDDTAQNAKFKNGNIFGKGLDSSLGYAIQRTENIVSSLSGALSEPFTTAILSRAGGGRKTSSDGDGAMPDIGNIGLDALGIEALDVSTSQSARGAVAAVDSAVGTVSAHRAVLSAQMSRMEGIASQLMTTSINLSAAASRIGDVDTAFETMASTRVKILTRARFSLSGQANQTQRRVLGLM